MASYTLYFKSAGDIWRRGRKSFRKLARAEAYACRTQKGGIAVRIINNDTGDERTPSCGLGRSKRRRRR